MLKRLCILLALKEAYIKAIGQPLGFDYTRLEFDVPNSRVTGDGNPIVGWEFRVFGAKLGVARGTKLKQDSIPLSYTPRKFIPHPTNGLLYLIEGDHRVIGEGAATKQLQQMVTSIRFLYTV